MNTLLRPWRLGLLGLVAVGLAGLSIAAARADDPPAKAPEKPAEPPKEAEKPAEKPADKPAEALPAPEPAAEFTCKDWEGKERKLSEFKGKWVVLEWTNYGCPFVVKHYKVTPAEGEKPAVAGKMAELQKTYCAKGVTWLSICSSAPAQGDKPPKEGWMSADGWKKAAQERMATPTTVLLDEDGKVGKAYGAKRTPTVFVIDPKGMVVYHGAPDDDSAIRGDPKKSHSYLAEVLDAVLAGKDAPMRETKPYGCSVKYAD